MPPPSAPPQTKNLSTGAKVMLFATIGVVLFGVCVDLQIKDKERRTDAGVVTVAQAAPPPRVEPPFSHWMLVSNLLALHGTNQIAAEQEASGPNKYLLGTVSMVRSEIRGQPYLLLGELPFVRASFQGAEPEVDLATVARLREGDLVGVRCEGAGKLLLSIGFTKCELLWVAKETDPSTWVVSEQLCGFEFFEAALDGGSPSYGNGYFNEQNAQKAREAKLPPNFIPLMRKTSAKLYEKVRTEKIARVPCTTPSLWALHRCDGERDHECKSPQMMEFQKRLLRDR